MSPSLNSLDHLVLTVADLDTTIAFYRDVLGMDAQAFRGTDGTDRWALSFGVQKINLHQRGREFDPKAAHPTAGSADLCFLSQTPIAQWVEHLIQSKTPIIEGPIRRTGAQGPILSIYLRDPDENLIEISNQIGA